MAISSWNTYEDIRADLAAWAIVAAIGWFGGWVHAHYTVGKECERLGTFYVGSKTFGCLIVKEAPKG
jgi:hypothetical protein